MNDTKHRRLMSELAGQHYNDVRSEIDSLDWDGIYPEVDLDGDLTGYVISASDTRYDICDVTDTGVSMHQHAADAMTLANAMCDSEIGDD